jgi:thiol:disulfide interchange protein DsbA
MKLWKIFLLIIFSVVLSASASAGEPPAIQGKYTKLIDHQFKFNGEDVEIVEFLSFYCGHCYLFEKQVPVVKGNFPKIKWRVVPIYWGNGSSKPGEAYLLALEAGKGEQMKKALFDAFFVEKRDIGDPAVLEDIGLKVGLGFDFSRRLRAGDKKKDADAAFIQVNAYGIEGTPTLIIAGNLKVVPGKDEGVEAFRDNVITILRSILRK